MLRSTLVLLAALLTWPAFTQTTSERAAVRLTATVQAASITLNWVAISSTTSLTVYRKTKSATSWGSAVATPAASALTWTDNTPVIGTNYEYRVVRVSAGVTATGYVSTGIQVPVTDYRGKMILLVDNTLAPQMVTELNQLTYDLRADGWTVLRTDVSRTASVTSIRSIVQGHYNSDPTNVKALYLVGHVPVPYSGNITPDGHDDGKGARPTDGYYADVNGTWTDNSVNTTIGTHQQSWNTPGDGKFDQSDFPSPIELQVGRVDLYDMPAFSSSEVQLVRNYLTKAHNYKVKGWAPTVRGLMIDKLTWLANPVAGSGWRTAPLTGSASPAPAAPILNFVDYANAQSYLWTYHCGGGLQALDGSVVTYNGTDGGATTQQLATTMLMGGAFNMAMGSFFYDFDNRNNFLRAIIARGDGLTNVWAGIPAWYFHHMGMGDNIGYSVLQSMNNTGLYTPLTEGWQTTIGRTHMNLMGDPSLRMKMVAPPTNLAVTNSGGYASFTWTASTESVLGYHIYQIDATTGLVTRLTTTPVTATSYSNGAIPFVAGREYMVRAVKLETNYSGSFYNLSLGALATASGTGGGVADCLGVIGGSATVGSACNDNNACTTGDVWNASCQCVGTNITPTATITAAGATTFCAGGSVVLNGTTGTGVTYAWKRGGTAISGATSSSYTATLAGSYTLTVSNGSCSTTSNALTVTVNTAPTATITPASSTALCTGGSVVLNGATGTGYAYVWKRGGTTISGATASSYTASVAGSYTLTATSAGCSTTSAATTITVGSAPTATITAASATTFCNGGSVTLNSNTGTGYTYAWKRGTTVISGATSSSYNATIAGSYTATVSNGGCSTTSNALTITVNAAPTATITAASSTSLCTGGSVVLNGSSGTGYTYVWKRGGTTISGATASSFTASVAGSYTLTTTSGGCSTTSAATTVTVGTLPTATITAAGATTFCNGGSVTLNSTTGTGYTYAWKRGGTAISGAMSSSYSATISGSYTVTISSGGCSATSNAITVAAGTPSPTITAATTTSFCSGGSVALSTATVTGYTYGWRLNGTAISGATSSSYTASQAGSYTVTVTNGTCAAASAATIVTVTPVPNATLTAGGPTSICSSGSVPLIANTGTGLSYTWYRNNVAIAGASGSTYAATLAGSYSVTVTNNGCSKGSSLVSVSVTAGPTLTCTSNASAGTISVAATGGLAPYSYSWNTVPVKTTATATVTASGSYTVTVTDARGCISTCTSTITITPVNNCAGIRTETQTAWGATASTGNAAAFMVGNFGAAFPSPDHLTIGCGTRKLRLTSATAVTAFLPSTGTPARLASGTLQNPGASYGNSLAGQLVALKISVRFDELSNSFSPSTVLLKNMIIASGTFAGWTVQQLIDEADSKIGSCGGNYTRSTLNTALAAVNNGYAGGTTSSGYLQCPGSSGLVLQNDPVEENNLTIGSLDGALTVGVFPNPVTTTATLVIEGTSEEQPTVVDIYTLTGGLIEKRQLGVLPTDVPYRTQWNVEGRGAGVYLYRVVCGDRIATGRIVVE